MKMTRTRILSLVLALVMVFSMFPMSALAAAKFTTGELDAVTETVDYPIWDLSTKAAAEAGGFTQGTSGFYWSTSMRCSLEW